MTQKELENILEKHKKWLQGEDGGVRANLSGANLSGADLSGADLSGADLSGAYLSRANLSRANLYSSNLSGADLSGAYLCGANLSRDNLSRANLYSSNLYSSNLSRADLSGADLSGAIGIDNEELNKHFPIACPVDGAFIGWKKAKAGMIVKIQIAEDAKRTSGTGRKCRCDKAVVLAIENADGSPSGVDEIASKYDPEFFYRVGETVTVQNFDDDRTKECAPGIHFFITRNEAVNYGL